MWAKLAELIAKWFLIPLIKDGVKSAYNWVKNWWRKRILKKTNTKKVENYENANNSDDARDSFEQLP